MHAAAVHLQPGREGGRRRHVRPIFQRDPPPTGQHEREAVTQRVRSRFPSGIFLFILGRADYLKEIFLAAVSKTIGGG